MSNKTLLEKSIDEELDLYIEQYTKLDEFINEYTRRKDLLQNQIIDVYESYDIQKHKGVKLLHRTDDVKMTIGEFKELFKDNELNDYISITINKDESYDNLNYKLNVSEPIISSMKEKLDNLKGYKVKKLIIERE